MKKATLITLIILVNFALAFSQTKKDAVTVIQPKEPRISQAKNPAEKDLEDLEFKLSDALVSKDAVTLEKIIAEDFIIAGSTITKKLYIDIAKSQQLKFFGIEKSEMQIKIYGETAVISGRNKADRKIENGISSSFFNYLNVWVKSKNGEWQCVAMSQDSVLLIFSYQ